MVVLEYINIRNRNGDDEGRHDDVSCTEFELLAIYPVGNIYQSHGNVRLALGGETEPKCKSGHNAHGCDKSIA